MSPSGVLSILIGGRVTTFKCPTGLSFYGLQSLIAKIEQVLDEREIVVVDRRQIDLEDAIAARSAVA
jgi:hypothetical protein